MQKSRDEFTVGARSSWRVRDQPWQKDRRTCLGCVSLVMSSTTWMETHTADFTVLVNQRVPSAVEVILSLLVPPSVTRRILWLSVLVCARSPDRRIGGNGSSERNTTLQLLRLIDRGDGTFAIHICARSRGSHSRHIDRQRDTLGVWRREVGEGDGADLSVGGARLGGGIAGLHEAVAVGVEGRVGACGVWISHGSFGV
jgi:hypothetical protein